MKKIILYTALYVVFLMVVILGVPWLMRASIWSDKKAEAYFAEPKSKYQEPNLIERSMP